MINVSPAAAEEFKRLVKKEYSVEFSDTEAQEAADRLLSVFKILLRVDVRLKSKNESS